jgi:hypothetical protein
MKIILSALLAAVVSAPLQARSTLAMYSPEQDIDAPLKAWLRTDASVRQKVHALAKTPAGFNNEDMTDLKDAIGPAADAARLQQVIGKSTGSRKRRLMERLPGMKAEPLASCRTLSGCVEAPVSYHVDDSDHIVEAAAALARPWVILQKARGQSLSFEASIESGGRLLNFMLEDKPELLMSIEAKRSAKEGGFDVILKGPTDPASLFEHERQATLASLAKR